jgi:hypothetical protein
MSTHDTGWGNFRIQKRGKAKWTSLRQRAVMFWGKGYELTREQAALVAEAELQRHRSEDPSGEYRIHPPV